MPRSASYLNLCRPCGKDFASVKAFDKHRVGRHEPMERRCMTDTEMESAGFAQDERGRWLVSGDRERTRSYWKSVPRTATGR